MKKILAFTLLLLMFATAFSQTDSTKYWTKGVTTSIAFSQVSFTNWAAGGEGSVALNGLINSFANYSKDKNSWENTLDLGYGLIKTKNQDFVKKSDDKIVLLSKYAYKLNKNFRITAIAEFRSQFANGYTYPSDTEKTLVSGFMAPGYLTASIGADYTPFDFLTINYSPATAKFTFVTIPELQVQYGNDSAQVCKTRFGSELRLSFKKEVVKNVDVATNVSAFTDYLDNKPFDVAINWDLLIFMKINKFLTANISTNLIWDKNILTTDTNNDGVNDVSKVQFKELVGVGFTVSF
ncbi:MAG: DUF3078 domain-containing protein [Bacteroidales bacterium]|jgi:hypothetical protein|nr:DUF3078 domain-containing protein [Bacteroidales bacterium]MDD2204463.1 DUF3078 domain-containing protein [Bacteroidales bacterium]MDD3152798.1 DUF3078 domain-containing protein [Bacteroidales bacterium]MDD3913951.1 DUF3078 domain-containing protein [Bacteroidales bacterium]MDD4633743.1 DUF3078 domain-containing protein [Bacteroidales bacterium]